MNKGIWKKKFFKIKVQIKKIIKYLILYFHQQVKKFVYPIDFKVIYIVYS